MRETLLCGHSWDVVSGGSRVPEPGIRCCLEQAGLQQSRPNGVPKFIMEFAQWPGGGCLLKCKCITSPTGGDLRHANAIDGVSAQSVSLRVLLCACASMPVCLLLAV